MFINLWRDYKHYTKKNIKKKKKKISFTLRMGMLF